MENSNSKLEESMIQIGNKYSFETVKKLKTTPHISTNTLFFWRESFEFPMSIALDEEEIDNDFMLFINDSDISNPLFGYIDGELEDICFDVYHAWVGFNFQKAKLYERGIPMGITINSDIVSYYFNDFSYDNFSDYHQVYETDKRVTRPFHRDLTIEEIFIRTHLVRFPYTVIELFAQNEDYIEQMKMEHSIMQVTKSELSTGNLLSMTENQFEVGNRYERKENSDIDQLIKYFESTVNKGYTFQLDKCSIEK
ncbi:MAG: hypothetical protein P1U56_17535 [Saprospiraceae bacterium]|nr:hypothetical protein [Saprospiraceae bacterium]